jgi:hypothetical protein
VDQEIRSTDVLEQNSNESSTAPYYQLPFICVHFEHIPYKTIYANLYVDNYTVHCIIVAEISKQSKHG